MKNIRLIGFLVLSNYLSLAQQESIADIPRLKRELASATEDSSRVIILTEMAEAYRWSHPDSSFQLARQALIQARNLNFERGESKALIVLSVIKREFGLIPESIEDALKALRIGQSIMDDRLIWAANIRIANVYNLIKNYETAINYYQSALKVVHNLKEKMLIEASFLLPARCFADMGLPDSAKLYVDKSLQIGTYTNEVSSLLYNVQAKIAEAENRYQEAISIYQKGVSNCKRLDNFSEAAGLNIGISKVFRKIGNRDSTIWYAREAQNYAEKLGHWEPIIQSSRILATEYENSNEDLAIYYFKKLITASDSLSSIAQLEAFEDVLLTDQQQQMEIKRSRAEVINRARIYVLITVLFFTLVIVFILVRNNRRKQRANQKLEAQKEQIEIQRSQLQQSLEQLKATQSQLIQSEKMASLGELTAGIAHEIQNPLNFVNNFSEVNQELADELKEELAGGHQEQASKLADDIKENSGKIHEHGKRADAIVKSMLQHSRTSSGEKELTDINALCDEYLRLAYHGFRAKDKSFSPNFEMDFDETIPNLHIVPQDIGRVILNLINNAFYAVHVKRQNFATPLYNPTVTVATKNFGEKIEIMISDNGPGIPNEIKEKIFQPFFTTKPTGEGTGLGLSLAYDIVKAHGGELLVASSAGQGTLFTITLNTN